MLSGSLNIKNRQKGGAMLAVIAGLLVVAASTLAIRMARQVEVKTELQQLTQTRIERIRAALHAFAATHGRLPCPAAGALDEGLAVPPNAVDVCTNRNGTVPWISLGLRSDDALDAWGRKISYRVYDGLSGMTRDRGADMTDCDTVESSPSSAAPPNFQCTPAHDVMPGPGAGTYLDLAGRPGLTVRVRGVNQVQMAWVLISHGASGNGAWLLDGGRVPVPVSVDELTNTQAPTIPPAPIVPFVQREENVVDLDPVSAPTHFDDLLLFETISQLIQAVGREARDWPETTPPPVTPIVGAPPGISLTTATLDSVSPISYSGRDTNRTSITINPGPDVGLIDITAAGGNITRNGVPNGTAIGVCTTGCGNDNNSSLSGTESISFKLQSKTAGKFALGVLSLDPTVEMSLTFKIGGAPIGSPIRVPLSPPLPALPLPPAAVTPGLLTVFVNLRPSPATPFDEVVVQPLGTSRFFIASIRFCAAAEVCD